MLKPFLKLSDISYFLFSKALRDLEQTAAYNHEKRSMNNVISTENRNVMILWFYNIVDQLDASRVIVEFATFYLDQYLFYLSTETKQTMNINLYRLSSLTALYLALKVHCSTKVSPKVFATLSNGAFRQSELSTMETDILFALKFRISPPSKKGMLDLYIGALLSVQNHANATNIPNKSTWKRISNIASYLCELSIMEERLRFYSPSMIAFSSLLVSMEKLVQFEYIYLCKEYLAKIINFSKEDNLVEQCCEVLRAALTESMSA